MKGKIISPMIEGLDNFLLAGQWLFSNRWMIREDWSERKGKIGKLEFKLQTQHLTLV